MATSLIVQYNELTLPPLTCIYTTSCSVMVKIYKQIRLWLANLRITTDITSDQKIQFKYAVLHHIQLCFDFQVQLLTGLPCKCNLVQNN